MNEQHDEFLDRLRNDAARLRYEPADPATWGRLEARIRARVETTQPTISDVLVAWFRPAFAAVALTLLALVWGGISLANDSWDTLLSNPETVVASDYSGLSQ